MFGTSLYSLWKLEGKDEEREFFMWMLRRLLLLKEGALKRAEVNSVCAWEIGAWEEEFYWKSKLKLTLGMWGSRAWEATPPDMVEGLGAFLCARDGLPRSTRMSQHQLRASLAGTSVNYLHPL